MKRITYISVVSDQFYPSDIITIGETSQKNNKRDGLTGVLFCFKDVFYQILEGEDSTVDECFNRIASDKRHKDIFVLETKNHIEGPEFPEWSMKTVRLDQETESLILPLRNMLDVITKTHFTLRKFTSSVILSDIQRGINPIERKFQTKNKIVLFSDIYNSTTLAEITPIDTFSRLLDVYYNIVNENIVRYGGTVSNIMGDGIMAFFDEDRTIDAVNACLSSLSSLKEMREKSKDIGRFLYAGFGLSWGDVLEGNIGSESHKEYTLIGNTVNTAARFEHITRQLKYSLVFGQNIAKRIVGTDMPIKKIGDYKPKGKEEVVEIYTIHSPQVMANAIEITKQIASLAPK